MKEKLMKLLKPFQGTKQQKQRLVNFVKENSGSGSDENVGVFLLTFGENLSLDFTLICGKPEIIDLGYGDKELKVIFSYSYSNLIFTGVTNYSIIFVTYSAESFNSIRYVVKQEYVQYYFEQLANANVGDTISILKNHLTIDNLFSHQSLIISANKNIGYEIDINNTNEFQLTYTEDNKVHYGKIVEDDKTNKFLFISINNQIWKYSYTLRSNGCYGSITFVEVVTP